MALQSCLDDDGCCHGLYHCFRDYLLNHLDVSLRDDLMCLRGDLLLLRDGDGSHRDPIGRANRNVYVLQDGSGGGGDSSNRVHHVDAKHVRHDR